ncbi:MAG: hypothetical protein IJT24_05600 [Lachnospiraceae bacterium]|nr:hypothetical protein [Lachnospiraceae bacterium]
MGIIKDKAIRTAIIAGATCAGAGLLHVLGQPLIIALGVRAASFLTTALACVGGAASLWSVSDLVIGGKKEHDRLLAEKKTARLMVENEEGHGEDMTSPDATRLRLCRIKDSSPGLSFLMDRCLAQMDRMDELQRRQGELIGLNQAAYLKDTVGTLDSVEKEICLNLRGVVNQCIVAGANADEGRLDMDKVEAILSGNQKLLEQSRELLVVSADWIDKYNAQEGGADRSLLDSWIKVIQDTINGTGRSQDLS